jgi:hypothetical protein
VLRTARCRIAAETPVTKWSYEFVLHDAHPIWMVSRAVFFKAKYFVQSFSPELAIRTLSCSEGTMEIPVMFTDPTLKPILCVEMHTTGEPTRIIYKG